MSTDRAPAQYCPYCGETNLWPHEASHGAWECRDCGRVFACRYLGLSGQVLLTQPSTPGGAS
jgi:ribosomal protein L37AE/L43A